VGADAVHTPGAVDDAAVASAAGSAAFTSALGAIQATSGSCASALTCAVADAAGSRSSTELSIQRLLSTVAPANVVCSRRSSNSVRLVSAAARNPATTAS
jgi:hypothetical protein